MDLTEQNLSIYSLKTKRKNKNKTKNKLKTYPKWQMESAKRGRCHTLNG